MKQYEIELKVLLGSTADREKFMTNARAKFPDMKQTLDESQLNHYFTGEVSTKIADAFEGKISPERLTELRSLIEKGSDFSIRSRFIAPDRTILVFKVAMGHGSAVHGGIREEWEETLPGMSIEELDTIMLGCGLKYLSKWSRKRQTYETGTGISLCIEQNAGYGHVVEIERVVHTERDGILARDELRRLARELGFEEVNPERLNRMFAYYNQHWPKYYGTEEIFTVL
jgi:adenylate cyclase class IV